MAIRLAIVGCGGMGHRHLRGLGELHAAGIRSLELVAACDPVEANAASTADHAEMVSGTRPTISAVLGDLHDYGVLAVEALQRGLHVLIEKPMASTIAGCWRIRDAAVVSPAILSVAENYRRDPMCRLGKALLDSGCDWQASTSRPAQRGRRRPNGYQHVAAPPRARRYPAGRRSSLRRRP